MRTDAGHRDLLAAEVGAGRMRQGWGYDKRLDLRRLRERAEAEALDGDEPDIWRRTWRVLVGEPGAFAIGDIVVIPRILSPGEWTVVRVTGDYRFEPDVTGDHGHIVPVEILVESLSPRHEGV